VSALRSNDGEQDEFVTPEMAAARAAFYGEGGIASCQRVVHSALPDRQIQVLENMTRDALMLAKRAGLDPIETIDGMSNTADAAGITARHGQDEVQAALGRAALAAQQSAVPDTTEGIDICSCQSTSQPSSAGSSKTRPGTAGQANHIPLQARCPKRRGELFSCREH
jgi:hypothetical protein